LFKPSLLPHRVFGPSGLAHSVPWKTIEQLELATPPGFTSTTLSASTDTWVMFPRQSSKQRSVLNTVRQKHWRKTQLWGLHKTQGGSEAYAVPVDAFTAAIESGSGSVQISAEEFGGWQEASIEILGWCANDVGYTKQP
jgi:hypothetical protein